MVRFLTLPFFIACTIVGTFAQNPPTANQLVKPYTGGFHPGANLGEYVGFDEYSQSTLAVGVPSMGIPGVGVKALRPALFEEVLDIRGYEALLPAFRHFDSLGLKDNTCIVGFPSEAHRDPNFYCPDIQSTLFANLYTPIWDGGANGTPYNDENYYAAYLYKTVSLYKPYVKFWEVWNEPGFDYSGQLGWLPPGIPNNWWENDPDPCDYKLRAPIQHYVRLLRISWEIIKTLDPDAYVVLSGTGYTSFLDAILRNTDNPLGGAVTTDYPNKGGAYFDVMGYHAYPHFDGSLRAWNEPNQTWDYFRHSDAAAEGIIATQTGFQELLDTYGYNGTTLPNKRWTITECNLPRMPYEDFIGSAEAQRNFMIKGYVACAKNDIDQWHIYKLAEDTDVEHATFEFDLMGLYQQLRFVNRLNQTPNDEGIALGTASLLLFGKKYSQSLTAALQLPANIGGGAFVDNDGNATVVLWAKTNLDMSETATAAYSFPNHPAFQQMSKRSWNFQQTHEVVALTQLQNIALTGTPTFYSAHKLKLNAATGCVPFTVNAFFTGTNGLTSKWTFNENGNITEFTGNQAQSYTFQETGQHTIRVEVSLNGQLQWAETRTLTVNALPVVAFESNVSGPIVQFVHRSSGNIDAFQWDFGDGTTSTEPSPYHVYFNTGTYPVQLTITNECGSQTLLKQLFVKAPSTNSSITTADENVIPYLKAFRPGVNMEYYQGWEDEELGEIAAGNPFANIKGVGARSFRTILGEFFVNFWGYDVRQSLFESNNNIDLRDNTLTLGFPAIDSQDPSYYCPNHRSTLFANAYLDIWDNGLNGTPINEENPFAVYVYNMVQSYKDYVTFWEVYNSPDFDFTGDYAWLPRGEPGNWWDNDPDPCDYELRAPITHYVRLLRIAYEIIHTYDPDGYVTISGIAYPSFLDAILRNTDNPLDGKIAAPYPKLGGAYFDAIGFKSFPHFDGSTIYYDVNAGGFAYERHSDAAANGLTRLKNQFNEVLEDYDYGISLPKKEWIVSEANVPRKAFAPYFGSSEVQRNWLLKALVNAHKNDIRQFNVFRISEQGQFVTAKDEFDVMGLYEILNNIPVGEQIAHPSGVAMATFTDLLFGTRYDAAKTAAMNLPSTVEGAAFMDGQGRHHYILWAKTTVDQSEIAQATYTFPVSFGISNLTRRTWEFSRTGASTNLSSTLVPLTGTPLFLSAENQVAQVPLAAFSANQLSVCAGQSIQFNAAPSLGNPTGFLWEIEGGSPSTSTLSNPTITFPTGGNYTVKLTASNANGSHTAIKEDYIFIESAPIATFSYIKDSGSVSFTHTSTSADSVYWRFGDGYEGPAYFPTHFYQSNGTFTVWFYAYNECGGDSTSQTVQIAVAPSTQFSYQSNGGCDNFNVQFQDLTTGNHDTYAWTFENGIPATSSDRFPQVLFPGSGTYGVSLTVSNTFGSNTLNKTINLGQPIVAQLDTLICYGEEFEIQNQVLNAAQPTASLLYPDAAVNGCDSILEVTVRFRLPQEGQFFDTIAVGEVITLEHQTFTLPGNYEFTTLGSYGCDSTIYVTLYPGVSTTKESLSISDIQLYPNPSPSQIHLQFEIFASMKMSVAIFNSNGILMQSLYDWTPWSQGKHEVSFPVYHLPSGQYFVLFRQFDGAVRSISFQKI